jgi:hypothetical protein
LKTPGYVIKLSTVIHQEINNTAYLFIMKEISMQIVEERKISTSISTEPKLILCAGIAIGLLLLTIGDSVGQSAVSHVGTFIASFSLFGGGLYLKEENVAIRITLLAIAGIFVASGLLGISSIFSVFGR